MRRLRLALVALVLMLGLGFGLGERPAAALPGLPNPCDLAPSGALQDACNAAAGVISNPIGAATGAVGSAAGGVVANAAGGIFDTGLSWMTGLLADTVKGTLDEIGKALSGAPSAPIDADWFWGVYAPLGVMGVILCCFVMAAHVIINLVRFRTAAMGRAFGMAVLAIFLTATAPLLITVALRFADGLSAGLAAWGGADAGQLVDKVSEISTSLTLTGTAAQIAKPLVLIVFMIVALVVALFWMVLLAVRGELVFIGTLAMPFVLPSIIDGKARFAKLYVRVMFGIIISAPILIGVLVVGATLFKHGYVNQDGLWPLITAVGLMLAAGFLPFVVIHLLVPAAAPVAAVVERAGQSVIHFSRDHVREIATVAAGAITGGAATVAAAGAAGSGERQPPPLPTMPASAPPDDYTARLEAHKARWAEPAPGPTS